MSLRLTSDICRAMTLCIRRKLSETLSWIGSSAHDPVKFSCLPHGPSFTLARVDIRTDDIHNI